MKNSTYYRFCLFSIALLQVSLSATAQQVYEPGETYGAQKIDGIEIFGQEIRGTGLTNHDYVSNGPSSSDFYENKAVVLRDTPNNALMLEVYAQTCFIVIDPHDQAPQTCNVRATGSTSSKARAKMFKRFSVSEGSSDDKVSLPANIYLQLAYAGKIATFSAFTKATLAINARLWDLTDNREVQLIEMLEEEKGGGFGKHILVGVPGIPVLKLPIPLPDVSNPREAERHSLSVQLIRGHDYEFQLYVAATAESGGATYGPAEINFHDPELILSGQQDGFIQLNELTVDIGSDPSEKIAELEERLEALENHTHECSRKRVTKTSIWGTTYQVWKMVCATPEN